MVTPSYGSWASSTSVAEMVTVALAGDGPTMVVGAILNPLAGVRSRDQLRNFRIETSLDGSTFTTAYEGQLKAARIDQAFIFDAPVNARYLRLTGLDSQSGSTNGGYVGELRLIAADPALFGEHDLADPVLGGHVVWSDPHTENNNF